jgi:hypothetical protein
MAKVKQFVREAFEVDELAYQFEVIDLEDGLLKTASLEEVSSKYSLSHILNEAAWRLDMAESNEHDDDIRQLSNFINKWSK